jgi:hypothetical protein
MMDKPTNDMPFRNGSRSAPQVNEICSTGAEKHVGYARLIQDAFALYR